MNPCHLVRATRVHVVFLYVCKILRNIDTGVTLCDVVIPSLSPSVSLLTYNFFTIFIADGTSVPLTYHYVDDGNYYRTTINNGDNINPLERLYSISKQKWHKDTVAPISLLPPTKGMPARSHHR